MCSESLWTDPEFESPESSVHRHVALSHACEGKFNLMEEGWGGGCRGAEPCACACEQASKQAKQESLFVNCILGFHSSVVGVRC